jgi:hypothetical protein
VLTLTHFLGFNFQNVFPYPDFEGNILCNTLILYGGFVRDREGNVCYRSFSSSTQLIGKWNKVKGGIYVILNLKCLNQRENFEEIFQNVEG